MRLRKGKGVLAWILVCTTVLTLAQPAFAAEENGQGEQIVFENAEEAVTSELPAEEEEVILPEEEPAPAAPEEEVPIPAADPAEENPEPGKPDKETPMPVTTPEEEEIVISPEDNEPSPVILEEDSSSPEISLEEELEPLTEQEDAVSSGLPEEEEIISEEELPFIEESWDSITKDNDELLQDYIDRQLAAGSGRQRLKAARVSNLNAVEAHLYYQLRTEIIKIAAGEESSTKITVPLPDSVRNKKYYAEDCGVDSIDCVDAFQWFGENVFDYKKIVWALLMDLPYEMYWADYTKTGGYSVGGISIGSNYFRWQNLTIGFKVAKEYSSTNEINTCSVNATLPARITTAVNRINAVVQEGKSYTTDYDKLNFFAEKICSYNVYNYYAAEDKNQVPYGDPWQLIYVFDDDDTTTVVCEGYAKAFQHLCDLSDFQDDVACYYIRGYFGAYGMNGHAWNLVRMGNGKTYLVDVTHFDDKYSSDYKLDRFLSGGTNVSADGFTTKILGENYFYDDITKAQYGADELIISETSYTDDMDVSGIISFTVNPDFLMLERGSNITLSAEKFEFEAGSSRNTGVEWSTDDTDVLHLSRTGTITGLKNGEAFVTATSVKGKKKQTSRIIVSDSNSGFYTDSAERTYYFENGLPVKSAFRTIGADRWYFDGNGEGAIYIGPAYSIQYDGNGATSGAMSNSTGVAVDEQFTLKANAFRRTGYTFTGWNTAADGSGTTYTDQASVQNLSTTNGATVTLYAQWTPIRYSIQYNSNADDATGEMSNSTGIAYDASYTLTANAYERTGYIFTGWNTTAGGSGTVYADAASVQKLTTTEGATVTLYAQWTPIRYSIRYNGNGATSGEMDDSTDIAYDTVFTLTVNAFEKTGYVFIGWNTRPDGTGIIQADNTEVMNLTESNNGIVDLYAQWSPVRYSIYYDGNGATSGNMTFTTSCIYDEAFQLKENEFAKTDYVFVGWNTAADGSGTNYENAAVVRNLTTTNYTTVTLYAQWSLRGALPAPSGLFWTGLSTANWNAVENAAAYRVSMSMYKQAEGLEGTDAPFDVLVKTIDNVAETDGTSADLQAWMTDYRFMYDEANDEYFMAPEVRFTFRVTALADEMGSLYKDSVASAESGELIEYNPAELKLLPRLQNLHWEGDTLVWNPVENAGDYEIVAFVRENGVEKEYWLDMTTETQMAKADLTKALEEKLFQEGWFWENRRWEQPVRYRLVVRARADWSYLTKYSFASVENLSYLHGSFTKLVSPQNVQWSMGSYLPLTVSWNSVAGARKYLLSVYVSVDDGLTYSAPWIFDRGSVSAISEDGWSFYNYSVKRMVEDYCENNGIASGTPLKVKASVTAQYDENGLSPYNSNVAETGVTDWTYQDSRLPAPEGVAWGGNEGFTVSWNAVEGAAGYRIYLYLLDEENMPVMLISETFYEPEQTSVNLLNIMRERYELESTWGGSYSYRYGVRIGTYNDDYKVGNPSDMVGPVVYYPTGQLNSIRISPEKSVMRVGQQKQFTLNVSPQDVSYGNSAKWSLTDSTMGWIDFRGGITCWKPGTTEVTVTIDELSDTASVLVYEINIGEETGDVANTGNGEGDAELIMETGSSVVDAAIDNMYGDSFDETVVPENTEEFNWTRFREAVEETPDGAFDIHATQTETATSEEATQWLQDQLDAETHLTGRGRDVKVVKTVDVKIGFGKKDDPFCYLTKFDEPIGFEVTVPDDLPAPAKGMKHKFSLIRNHNGVMEIVPVKRGADGKYRGYSDSFSEFTLIYEDMDPSQVEDDFAYTITYHLNGGKNPVNAPEEYTDAGEAVTLPTPARTGYTFAGWYSDAAFKTRVTNIAKGSTGDKEFYAKWMPVTYTVKYHINGGKAGTMANTTGCKYDTAFALRANAFTRPYYTFAGWNTRADGKGTTYANKASVKNLTATNGATVTLYAMWKPVSYKITYNLNGGKNNAKNPATYTVESAAIKLQNPTKTGYTFGGWYSDKALKTRVTTIAKGSTGNRTLYAKWTIATYKITYSLGGGKNSTKNPASYKVTTATIKLQNPTRTGYTFGGWYADKTFKTRVTQIPKGSAGNKTLYAKWTATKYKITYNLNGGTNNAKNPATYTIATAKITLANPTKTGYTFGGWYADKAFKTKVTAIAKGSTGNKTLYAKWTVNTYSIKYHANGGTGTMKLQTGLQYGKAYRLTANTMTRKGYTFVGWNTKADGTGKTYANKASVKNLSTKNKATVTLYAQWTEG